MKFHSHVIIEPPRGKMIWYPRWFFDLYRGPEYGQGKMLSGHVELVVSKPIPEFGISLEVGTRGSQTPFDGHVKIAGTTVYWGIEQGSKLADRITQRWLRKRSGRMAIACLDRTCDCPTGKYRPGDTSQIHPNDSHDRYEGRQLSVRLDGWDLWISAWVRRNSWTKGEFANWRHAHINLNPLDRWLGETRYWYEDVETRTLTIQLPEDFYTVEAKLRRVFRGRPRGRRIQQPYSVGVDSKKGIPDRYDSSGGWKGDRVYGFSVELRQGHRPDWWIDAKAAIESRILANRARYGFRKPLPVESDSP